MMKKKEKKKFNSTVSDFKLNSYSRNLPALSCSTSLIKNKFLLLRIFHWVLTVANVEVIGVKSDLPFISSYTKHFIGENYDL